MNLKMQSIVRDIVMLSIMMAVGRSDELKDYCLNHTFDNLPGGLVFTKEVVTMEYANVGAFKALHCCLRGYRSIEWYKDNKPYPWPGGKSNFILYPESANQTIYTQVMRVSDAGRYSCQARNDTTTLEGDITLAVLGDKSTRYAGKPLLTYRPVSQLVSLGDSTRLYCEAYLGKVQVPDATSYVTWSKHDDNTTLPSYGRIAQHKSLRDRDQIVGSYLEIQDINLNDYGEYRCSVSNGVDDEITLPVHIYRQEPQFGLNLHNGSWQKSLLLTVLVLVLLVSAAAFYSRCWLPLVLFCRDKFGTLEENDGKECDALVCYHEKDSSLTIGIVIPTLESRYRYKCTTLELPHLTQNWSTEISAQASTARRIIVILSPASLGNIWTDASVGTVLKQLSSLTSTRTIVVTLKYLPNTTATIAKRSRHDRHADDISFDRLTLLHWQDGGGNRSTSGAGRKFWCKLRLVMPAIRPVASETGCQSVAMIVQANGKCGQQKANSRESLEVLV